MPKYVKEGIDIADAWYVMQHRFAWYQQCARHDRHRIIFTAANRNRSF
jgi:hypothetical protein